MVITEKDKIVWRASKKLDAMDLQVSLTSVGESLDEVETLSAERFRMLHSSKLILVHKKTTRRRGYDSSQQRWFSLSFEEGVTWSLFNLVEIKAELEGLGRKWISWKRNPFAILSGGMPS